MATSRVSKRLQVPFLVGAGAREGEGRMQNLQTTCGHNAPGQARVPGRAIPCRKCGALLEPEERAVNANDEVSVAGIAAGYPGERQA